VPAGSGRAGRSSSTSACPGGADGPRPTVLTADRQVRRLSLVDVPTPVEPVTRGDRAEELQQPQRRRPAGPGVDAAQRARRRARAAGDAAASRVERRGGRDAAAAPPPAAVPPLPRLRGARGPRALGRAVVAALAGDDGAGAAASRGARTRSPASSTGSATC
jgi:hypothetical protein